MKKMFLRVMALLLVVVIAISAFASCGSNEDSKEQNNGTQNEKEEVDNSEKTPDDESTSDESASDESESNSESISEDVGEEELEFVLLEDGTYRVKVGNARHLSRIVIPPEYNGKPVTSIGEYAFAYCYEMISIDIPDSVTSIGENAFLGGG